MAGRRDAVLGIAAAGRQRRNASADFPFRYAFTQRRDAARDFEAEHRRGIGRGRVLARALQHVGAIHAGADYFDQDLAGTGCGAGPSASVMQSASPPLAVGDVFHVGGASLGARRAGYHDRMPKTTSTYWNALSPASQDRWTWVKGLDGLVEELTLSVDPATGEYTRLTRFLPGADTSAFGGKSHAYPEEVYIVSGRLYDAAFDLWLEAGHYASRPPGEATWAVSHRGRLRGASVISESCGC
jgi:hypothetical protein